MILRNFNELSFMKFLNIKSIEKELEKYIVTDYAFIEKRMNLKFKPFEGDVVKLNPVILYGLTEYEKDIEIFYLPIINLEKKFIALDLRPYINVDKNNFNYEIRNQGEYNLALQRFILSGLWSIGKYIDLYSLKFAHFAFGNWISDNLTKRFALTLENAIQIKVAAYIYYAHLFTDNFTDEDFSKLIIRIREDILSTEIINDIYEKTKGKYDSLNDFCEACYLATNNIKLQGLDENVLLSLVTKNWMGTNGKNLSMISLEYPPIWISLVYASLTERNFNKNYIATIVDRLNKRGKGDDFLKAYVYLTKSYIENS